MPVRKLKPIEERDPYAALVMEAWDKLEEGNMTNVNHRPATPLPWSVNIEGDGTGFAVYQDDGHGNGSAVAVYPVAEGMRNAKYLQRAANAYPDLVTAARVAVEASRRYASIAPDEVARLKALQDVEFYRDLLHKLGEEF